jgi:SAM-dependent methyltransferase
MYNWPHLEKTEPRGSILYDVLKSHLLPGDRILDVNCAYSPLAKHLLADGYGITGFDVAPEPIDFLKKNHPGGSWSQIDVRTMYDNPMILGTFDVLILIGAGSIEDNDYVTATEMFHNKYLRPIIKMMKPRLVFLESPEIVSSDKDKKTLYINRGTTYYTTTFNVAVDICAENEYMVIESGRYEAELKELSIRFYALFEGKP